jgi:hypothetical protein
VVIGLGLVILLAISLVTWAVVTSPPPPRPEPTVSVSPPPPDVGQPVPAPGKAVISCARRATTLTCEWSYSNALATDQFDWRVFGTNARHQASLPKVAIPNAPAGLCIEVKVFRVDGSNAQAEWAKGCER